MQKKRNPKGAGRKWFDGKNEEAVRAKLEEGAALDATIEECCLLADISIHSYSRYMEKYPDFAVRLATLRNRPVLMARKIIMDKMSESYSNAMDYASRKRKGEFSQKQEIEHSGTLLIDDDKPKDS